MQVCNCRYYADMKATFVLYRYGGGGRNAIAAWVGLHAMNAVVTNATAMTRTIVICRRWQEIYLLMAAFHRYDGGGCCLYVTAPYCNERTCGCKTLAVRIYQGSSGTLLTGKRILVGFSQKCKIVMALFVHTWV